MRSWSKIIIFLGILGVLWACNQNNNKSNDPAPSSNTDREKLLTQVADSIIIPSFEIFKSKMDDLVSKSNTFQSNPSKSSLTALRSSWVDAYTEWQRVELFDVGPADSETLRSFMNVYPTSEQGINDNIASTSTIDLELPASYPRQGFPALDYLINGLASNDDTLITFYTTKSDAVKRIAYLKKLTDQMSAKVNLVYGEWKGDYRATFISKSSINSTSSISLLINGYVMNYERYIRAGKFGIPAGVMTGGTTYPEKVEAYYKKDISLTLAKAAHQASIDFFNGKNRKSGTEGYSLKTYLNGLNAKDSKTGGDLSTTINAQFDAANAKLALLNENFSQQVVSNNQSMVDVYNEMQKAVRMLKVDMTSAMSITITYTDNDGD